MTTTAWFTSRNNSNGRPEITMFDTASEQEAIARLRDTLEVSGRASREWNGPR